MSVERLKELPRKHGVGGVERLQAAASSYRWLTPAHPDPLGEQLVSLAEAIEKAETEHGDGAASHPRRRFSSISALSAKKIPICGYLAAAGRAYKPPEARTAEEAAAADAYEASRTGEEREAFGVALSSMQIWYVHPLLTASHRARCRRVMRASPDMEEETHAWLTPPLLHSLPTYSTALSPQRGWPTCESSWVALAKVSARLCWRPSLTLSAPSGTAGRRRYSGGDGAARRSQALHVEEGRSADGHRAQHADDPLHLSRHEGARLLTRLGRRRGGGAEVLLSTSATVASKTSISIGGRGGVVQRARCRS